MIRFRMQDCAYVYIIESGLAFDSRLELGSKLIMNFTIRPSDTSTLSSRAAINNSDTVFYHIHDSHAIYMYVLAKTLAIVDFKLLYYTDILPIRRTILAVVTLLSN